jgi:nucleotide-binding universal stress UspA family protein
MSYRTILVPVGQPDSAASAIAAAFLVAKRFTGHVHALHVLPDLADPATHALMATRMSLDAATSDFRKFKGSAERELQRQASDLKRQFETAAARAGAPIQDAPDAVARLSASWQQVSGFESEMVGRLGRIFDLTVIARRGPRGSSHDTVQAALLETGRPMLLTPPAVPDAIGDAVLLAWNASPQAGRAAASALPFLRNLRGSSSCRSATGPSRRRARTSSPERSPCTASAPRPATSSRARAVSATFSSPKPRRWRPTSWSSAPTRAAACGKWCSAA